MKRGIGAKSRESLSKVMGASKGVITPRLVSEVLSVTEQEAGRLVSRWAKAGWLKRVKRGAYILVPLDQSPEKFAIENPWAVATELYGPGYIGGLSAVSHWDLTEQIIETTFYFSTTKSRAVDEKLGSQKVHLVPAKKEQLFGLEVVWQQNIKIHISDPSRTMIDLLNNPVLAGGMTPLLDFFKEYLESDQKDLGKLIEYGDILNNKTVFKRLGFILEVLNVEGDIAELLLKKLSSGYSELDPSVKGEVIVTKWKLKMTPSWKQMYDRKK